MSNKKHEIYLKRKFDTYLAEWKSRDDRLPLIIKGARQVGKTECVRHFAEGRYKSVVEINFVERPEFKAIVRDGYSVASVIRNISSVEPAFRFVDNETLVFFDEIQEFPEIATSFKFFAQDGRFDVIASGSLLGVHYRRIESISVGFQESVEMRSLDFEEFLWARGYSKDQIASLVEPLLRRVPFSDAVKNSLDRLFMDYCALGGMPAVVENYFLKGTFEGVCAFSRGSSGTIVRIFENTARDLILCGFLPCSTRYLRNLRRKTRSSSGRPLNMVPRQRTTGVASSG